LYSYSLNVTSYIHKNSTDWFAVFNNTIDASNVFLPKFLIYNQRLFL